LSIFLVLPLLACIFTSILATIVCCRGPRDRSSRDAALLLGGVSFWAACEVLWNSRSDPDFAFACIKASTLGWVFIGPLGVRLALAATGEAAPRIRRALPALIATGALFLLLDWFTPWFHTGVARTHWGWGYELGPAFALFHLYALGCMWLAFSVGRQAYRGMDTEEEGEVLETLPDGVAMLRLDGRIRYGNSAMAKLLGHPTSHLDGLDVRELIQGLRGRPIDELTEVECELSNDDGDAVPISLSSATLSDRQGSPIGIVLIARDLRELEVLRGRLVVSGRLAAVGELAAGIAHEINNPLAYVRANLSLLRQHWESLGIELEKSRTSGSWDELIAEGAEMIDESLEGVDRASAIVRDVKGLAHAGRGERSMADLNELLDGVLRMAAPQLRVTAVVEKDYGLLPLVACAPQELQQVFLNLVLNASQAIADRGKIRVRTEAQGGSVMVWIEDDGRGMDADLLDRIFDPFFTTKPVGEGTGLGLGIAHEIVRKHGGEISIDSKPGRGSVFSVRLPVRVDTLEGELN